MNILEILNPQPWGARIPSEKYPGFELGEVVKVSGGPLHDEAGVVVVNGIWAPRFPETFFWKAGRLQVVKFSK